MMRDARYAQKRHTSYLQAHTDAIILFLLKNERNRLILTQIVNKNKPMKDYKFKNKNDCQYRTKHNNLLDAFRFNLKHHQ